MPQSRRPPEMTSTVEVILARSDGARYELHPTICPRRTRVVTWLMAAVVAVGLVALVAVAIPATVPPAAAQQPPPAGGPAAPQTATALAARATEITNAVAALRQREQAAAGLLVAADADAARLRTQLGDL